MPLTLSQARQKLYRYVSPTLDTGIVTDRINSALERIYNSGKWKGLLTSVTFSSVPDPTAWWVEAIPSTITLPRQFQAVLGVTFNNIPRLTYPRWQEYMASGGGNIVAGTGMQKIIDAGDGFLTWADPTEYYHPRFEISDVGDVGKKIRFSAIDAMGNPVYDANGNASFEITLTSEGVTFDEAMVAKITSIDKDVTEGFVSLYAVHPQDAGLKSMIASYEPTETVPSYKRYKLVAADFTRTIDCLCKRRFVELVDGPDDNTTLIPGNEGALKMTLMALQYEDKNDLERADTYFQKALQLLNAELKEDMGAPIITLQMNPVGAAMRIPARY
jgi:hypothetical protein